MIAYENTTEPASVIMLPMFSEHLSRPRRRISGKPNLEKQMMKKATFSAYHSFKPHFILPK